MCFAEDGRIIGQGLASVFLLWLCFSTTYICQRSSRSISNGTFFDSKLSFFLPPPKNNTLDFLSPTPLLLLVLLHYPVITHTPPLHSSSSSFSSSTRNPPLNLPIPTLRPRPTLHPPRIRSLQMPRRDPTLIVRFRCAARNGGAIGAQDGHLIGGIDAFAPGRGFAGAGGVFAAGAAFLWE